MVSLWPFKGDKSDAATFEKTLSSLATKITKASSKNDSLRQQARRLRVGWVIYGGFAYILVFLILTLVTGWQQWGMYEYTVVAGGPPLLYVVRMAIITFYDWRVQSSQDNLDSLYKQRDTAIDKLKKATKYDSTQQLLDKYGSPKPSPKPKGAQQASPKGKPTGAQEQRVFRQPPPTANIRRNQPSAPQQPTSPQQGLADGNLSGIQAPPPQSQLAGPGNNLSPQSLQGAGEEFAPNAFGDAPPRYASQAAPSRWYDRIMDALLGEDETQARNRIALICQECRLVNGQAPPGVKGLEELGRWRCSACGAWNGQESEASKVMQHLGNMPVPATPTSPTSPTSPTVPMTESLVEANDDDEEEFNDDAAHGDEPSDGVLVSHDVGGDEDIDTPARSTRSRKGGKNK